MVPKGTRVGDEVFVLIGCRMPVLLRPVEGGRYRLVGVILMGGWEQAMGGLEKGDFMLEDVWIE